MASRFSWTQLKQFEQAALRARVPQDVAGLIPRTQISNYTWYRRASEYERNGEKTLCGNLWMVRMGFLIYVTCILYQQWRVVTFGWSEYQEHHCYHFDNIVYDKLSARTIPYHSPANWP
jgi:hypothetical protein